MIKIQHLILLATLIFLSGCGTSTTGSGAQFKLDTNRSKTATIYHYRQEGFMGGGRIHQVISNGKPLIEIGNGGYYKQVTPPKNIEYRSKIEIRTGFFGSLTNAITNSFADFDKRLSLNVEAGKRYFVRWGLTDAEEVSFDRGLKEINGLNEFNVKIGDIK